MSWRKLVVVSVGAALSIWAAGCGAGSKPIAVTVTASSTTVDPTNTATLTATVANDKKSAGVTWSVSGGGSLSNTSTTGATYTAPAPASSALSVTVTATSVADATKTGTVTITVPAGPSVATSTLAAGTVGTAYSATLSGTGGIPPYTWSITNGTLPAGLTMTAGGVISGTPMASAVGSTNLTFKMVDAGSPNPLSATSTLGLTINAAPAISFTTTTLANATYNAAYSATVAATGGAGTLTYAIASGALPTGLTMSSAGVISGTPTVVGTFSVTVRASDAFGDSATQALTLRAVYPPLAITQVTLPTGYVGSVYTATTLAATGGSGTGFSFALQSGSSLPAGLALSAAGSITGTPTAAGTTNFTVTVTDSASNNAALAMAIVVKPGISITTATTLPTGYAGSAYSQALAATGGSGTGYTWSISSGSSAPAGLSLSSAGVLSGTPTTTGTPTFSVTVTDSASNKATATFSMTIAAGISITTSTSLPYAYEGSVYAPVTLAATGGSGAPYTWTWAAASGSSLPAGLSLSTAGVISGTPTAAGSFTIAITAKDGAANTTTVNFTLKVEATLAVSSMTLPSGTINVAYSTTLTASGGSGAGYTWAVTAGANTLTPLNLALSAAGVLSGTPAATGTANFTVTVTDSQSHTATAALSVSIYNVLTITTAALPAGGVGVAYSQQLNAGGGSGSGYTWTTTGSSNLATLGLSLSSAGVISGTPTTADTASFTAKVTDSSSNTATQPLTILIYAGLTLPAPNPSSLPSTGFTNVAYSGTINVAGGSGNYSWSVTGLSDNLAATPSGGTVTIAGTPASAATVTFDVTVTDTTTHGTVTQNGYTITISNPTPVTLPSANPSSLGSATVNQSYTGAINASGGVPPYTWSINGTAVTAGGIPLGNGTLSASSTGGNTLSISGTPSSTGTVTLTNVKVTDKLSTTATQTYNITVNSAGSQVSGHINLNNCGGGTPPTFTVTINTTPQQQTTTDSSGNYSFASVPNGSYTITPSISGASSVFTPATLSATVNNANLSGQDFQAAVGYTISGTVSYSGSSTGQIYVALSNNSCGGSGQPGTSIATKGNYTIRGVQPGSYTISAWMDTVGEGHPDVADPQGTVSETVSTSNVSNANVTLADQSPTVPSAGPKLNMVIPANQGLVIAYGPLKSSSNDRLEAVTSYTLQWSTSSSFSSPSSLTFKANGTGGADVWIVNSSTAGMTGTFTDGTPYYFRAQGVLGSSQTAWSYYGGPGTSCTSSSCAVTATGGQLTSAANCNTITGSTCSTITGAVTIPTGVTASGPLYVGFYGGQSGIFATRIASPTTGSGSPNAFTLYVPNGQGYFFFGILDQHNNGLIDAGDPNNTGGNNSNANIVNVAGNLSGQDITLAGGNSEATVYTQYYDNTCSGCGSANIGYNLELDLIGASKLPVTATLVSGPNLLNPIDMVPCTDCGDGRLQLNESLLGATPAAGDTYTFNVTYSDATTDTVTAKVTAVLGAAQLATNLSPGNGANATSTPTFSWTYPSSASSYSYSFYLYENNGSGDIWDIPGSGSVGNGFNSSDIPGASITWGTDPTNASNTPNVGSLSSGTYSWAFQTNDINGNSAQAQTYFIVP